MMTNENTYERFTNRAWKALQFADEEVRRFNHEYIGTEHILLGLVKIDGGVAAYVLKEFDIDPRKVRLEVKKLMLRNTDIPCRGEIFQTDRTKKVISYAMEEAHNDDYDRVDTGHILLGLLRVYDGVAARVLMGLGFTPENVRDSVEDCLCGDTQVDRKETRRMTNEKELPANKPPMGCNPQWLVDERRFREIAAAVLRRIGMKDPIFTEWWEEIAQIAGRRAVQSSRDRKVPLRQVDEPDCGNRISGD